MKSRSLDGFFPPSEPTPIHISVFKPQTSLGEKLMAIRNRAIASGLPLLNADEIAEEICRQRGDFA